MKKRKFLSEVNDCYDHPYCKTHITPYTQLNISSSLVLNLYRSKGKKQLLFTKYQS